jgi:hypothetical protein
MYVVAPGGSARRSEGRSTMADRIDGHESFKKLVEWKLEMDVEGTRRQIIDRAHWLADDLTRLANGLEADVNYSFNTLGELQGNGVELDTWCAKLGYARETLKLFHQALREFEPEEPTN